MALKGKPHIGDRINKKIIAPLAAARSTRPTCYETERIKGDKNAADERAVLAQWQTPSDQEAELKKRIKIQKRRWMPLCMRSIRR